MPSLLVVEEDSAVIEAFRRGLQSLDVTILSTRTGRGAVELARAYHPDATLLGGELPDRPALEVLDELRASDPTMPVVVMTSNGTATATIEAIGRGAFDHVRKPLAIETLRGLVTRAFKSRRHRASAEESTPLVDRAEPPAKDSMIGECPAMREVYKTIGRVAAKKVNVLILGESGTGKELVARAIQRHSPRSAHPFLAVNCAAIPEPLLESELFGHEKGAFTGADGRRVGKFEECSGGTLFLDEVGDMTPIMQSKFLRVLQEGRFERVGGNKTVETDVRVIAATNRHLEQMVAAGQFRADLYYRLNVFTVRLPPLRQRTADLPLLVDHFLRLFCRELDRSPCEASAEALDRLSQYPWPGNVRELQSVLKRAVLQANGPTLAADDLPVELLNKSGPVLGLEDFVDERLRAASTDLHAEATAFMERILLAKVLKLTDGNQSWAARILNITRGTLRSKIRELGIAIHQVARIEAAEPAVPPPLAGKADSRRTFAAAPE